MAKSVKYTVNFLEAKEEDLHKYDVYNDYFSALSFTFIN